MSEDESERNTTEGVTGSMVPDPAEFFFETPLYTVFKVRKDREDGLRVREIEHPQDPLDAHCPWCDKESVFKLNSMGVRSSTPSDYVKNHTYVVLLQCTRDASHKFRFDIRIDSKGLQKIGQYPSLADLQQQELKKYKSVLGSSRHAELMRGVGLSAHGIGIGAFVYVRRVFESLLEEAHEDAKNDATWDEAAYQKARVAERIKLLKEHLPPFLVEHAELYRILSAGVHELSESECLNRFPAVLKGIEMILDEKLYEAERKRKREEASREIRGLER